LRSQAEAPLFRRLAEREGRRVHFAAVAVDFNRVLVAEYVRFVSYGFPVALSTPSDLDLVAAVGQVSMVPRTLLLDPRGRVILDFQDVGQTDFHRLERAILALFRDQPVGDRPRPLP
jgi:hypothetical protein